MQPEWRPLRSISIFGLNYYENSPKKREKKHTSETINKMNPNEAREKLL